MIMHPQALRALPGVFHDLASSIINRFVNLCELCASAGDLSLQMSDDPIICHFMQPNVVVRNQQVIKIYITTFMLREYLCLLGFSDM